MLSSERVWGDSENDVLPMPMIREDEPSHEMHSLEANKSGYGNSMSGLSVERLQPAATPYINKLGSSRKDVELKDTYFDMIDAPRGGYNDMKGHVRLTETTYTDPRKDISLTSLTDSHRDADEDRRAFATKSIKTFKRTYCTKADGLIQPDVVLSRLPFDRPVPTRVAGAALPLTLRAPRETVRILNNKNIAIPVNKSTESSNIPAVIGRARANYDDSNIGMDLTQRLAKPETVHSYVSTFATAGSREHMGDTTNIQGEINQRMRGGIMSGSQPINMELISQL